MRKPRGNLFLGASLVVAGVFLFFLQVQPGWFQSVFGGFYWPFILLGAAVLFWIAGFFNRLPGLIIPGTILAVLGSIFLYQVRTGDWESWAFVWALIPASVGLGMMLGSLLRGIRVMFRIGLWIFVANTILGLALWGIFRAPQALGRFWPLLLVGIGLIFLTNALVQSRKHSN